jgi:hypothetical protein
MHACHMGRRIPAAISRLPPLAKLRATTPTPPAALDPEDAEESRELAPVWSPPPPSAPPRPGAAACCCVRGNGGGGFERSDCLLARMPCDNKSSICAFAASRSV